MAMEFQQSFVVKAPADAVWAFLTDPRRAASALPGAAVTEQIDAQTFAGTLTMKIGPVQTQYQGRARFERLDPATRTAEIAGHGRDVKGRGAADLRLTSRVNERAPGETEVSVVSKITVTGILAQFGRGMLQDVSDQMFERFTAAVRAQLEAPPATATAPTGAAATLPTADAHAQPEPPRSMPAGSEPLDALAFGSQVAHRVLSRWARRPAFWLALAVLGAIFYFLALR